MFEKDAYDADVQASRRIQNFIGGLLKEYKRAMLLARDVVRQFLNTYVHWINPGEKTWDQDYVGRSLSSS